MKFMYCSECSKRMNPQEVARYGKASFRKCDGCRKIGRYASRYRLDVTMRNTLFNERKRRTPRKNDNKRDFYRQNVPYHPHHESVQAFLRQAPEDWVSQALLYGWGEGMPPIQDMSNGIVRYTESNRKVEQRAARFARRFVHPRLQEHLTDRDFELFFVDMKAKSYVPTYTFETVSGEDIRKWYHRDNYGSRDLGTLGNSCMQYPESQRSFDIYTKNPDTVQMIIARDEEVDKIYGRMLIWLDTNGTWHMDRPYGNEVVCRLLYKHGEDQGMVKIRGRNDNFRVQLSEWFFQYYPYMDTMGNMDAAQGQLILGDTRNVDALLQMHSTGGDKYAYGNGWQRCPRCNTARVALSYKDGMWCTRCDRMVGEGVISRVASILR